MATTSIPAHALQPGDLLIPTGRNVLRVVRDGLYARTADDRMIRGKRFPAGKVEVVLDDGKGVRYWGKHTRVTVQVKP